MIGCLVWGPIAIWVYGLISWTVMGEIDALFGIVGAMLGIVLGAAIMLQPNPQLAPFLVVGVFTLVAIFPWLRSIAQKRELAMIDIDAIERAYEQLQERPDGFGPRIRIARLIYARGLHGHAIVLAEETLKPLPRSIVEDDMRQLRLWKLAAQPHDFQSITCVDCGRENPPGTLFCSRCRAPILLFHARGAWTGRKTTRKLLAAWVACMAGMVGIPLAATTMPPAMSGVVVSLLLLGAAGLVYVAFRPEVRRV